MHPYDISSIKEYMYESKYPENVQNGTHDQTHTSILNNTGSQT